MAITKMSIGVMSVNRFTVRRGARGGGKTDGVLGEFGAHASRYGKDAIGASGGRQRFTPRRLRASTGSASPAPGSASPALHSLW
jgi:hypothetical protein